MSDLIKASVDGLCDLAASELAVGNVIETPLGVSIIPVSRVHVGFATGGVDLGQKRLLSEKSFGGGGGSGISVTPLAFLAVSDKGVTVHNVGGDTSALERFISLLEESPVIIEKIKSALG